MSGFSNKKDNGQYFTIDTGLQNFIYNHVKHQGCPLLEPAVGAGHLLQPFLAADPHYPMTCYEIDKSIKPVVTLDNPILYNDFLSLTHGETRYKTIIGNPPYVKKKGKGPNLYIKFIERCFDLLTDDGELLFIIPSDFFKLTGASALISRMDSAGTFTDFYYPHDESLFEGASVDIVVFRYERGLQNGRNATVNGEPKSYSVCSGILTFDSGNAMHIFDLFDVYVGLVSAKDDVYKNTLGNIDVLTDENRHEKFIYVKEYPCSNVQINNHLETHKTALISRKIRKFSQKNWYEWGAPRNIGLMESHVGRPCIYVKMLTRQTRVAWTGTLGYFGGALLCMVVKEGAPVDLEKIADHLNSEAFRKRYIYAGRFKIGQKQLSQATMC